MTLLLDSNYLRGRAAPAWPTTTLPSGYTVTCRRLASGIVAQLNAQAAKELEVERPRPPVQGVEIAPGTLREEPIDDDPDYQAALAIWNDKIKTASATKLLKVIQNYALLTPTDEEAVSEFRAAMAAVGVEVAADDREVFVWSIVAPTGRDVEALIAFVIGISEAQAEAIKAQQATFRGDVSGPVA